MMPYGRLDLFYRYIEKGTTTWQLKHLVIAAA